MGSAEPRRDALSREQMSRYRRQLSLNGFGLGGQERVAAGHVVVVGAGGLGSPALLYLAGVGMGRVTVIDDDAVELSNLHRQVIHAEAAVGTNKAESAAGEMSRRNGSVDVSVVEVRVSASNAAELLRGADVVLDGTDNFDARYAISDACAELGVPHVWGSILGFDAQLSTFWAGRGPTYRDVFPEAPPVGSVPSCAQAGVLGPVVGVAGTMMALEAVKLLAGVGQPLVGRIAYFSGLDGQWEYIPVAAQVEFEPVPASPAADAVDGDGTYYLDVREPHEFEPFHVPGAVNAPLSVLESDEDALESAVRELQEIVDAGRDVVVYCAAGVRSERALDMMKARGLESATGCGADDGAGNKVGNVSSMPGGIEAWFDGAG